MEAEQIRVIEPVSRAIQETIRLSNVRIIIALNDTIFYSYLNINYNGVILKISKTD